MKLFRGDQGTAGRLHRIEQTLARLSEQGRTIMSQLDDLKAALAAEDTNIEAVLALVSAETAQIADLTAKLAAAIAAGAPDLAPQIADIQARTAALAAVLPPPTPPPAA